MNNYERLYNILIENQVPEGDPPLPGMSSKDLTHYKGRPSRKKVKKRGDKRSKKTKAADLRAEKKEAAINNAAARRTRMK
jgi:hypothetical protein